MSQSRVSMGQVTHISEQETETLFYAIAQKAYVSLVGTGASIRQKVSINVLFQKCPKAIARDLIHSCVRNITLLEAKKIPSDNDCSPFVSVACQCARDHSSGDTLATIIDEIRPLDPLNPIPLISRRCVDTILTPLDPLTLRARIVVATTRAPDPQEQARKLQMAEFRHQELLNNLFHNLLIRNNSEAEDSGLLAEPGMPLSETFLLVL